MKLSEALKISQTDPGPGAEKFRVYLACGFTPLHLATFLAAHLRLRVPSRDVEIQTGRYGDLTGTLARLRESSGDAAALVLEWSDLDPRLGLRSLGGWEPRVLADVQETVGSSAIRILGLLEAAAKATPVFLCLPTLPLPPISYLPASQSGPFDLFVRKTLQDFGLKAAEIPRVKVLSQQRLDELSPLAERLDVKSDLMTGFPYRLAHAASMAELLALLIEPRAPKKGLITDLDDTLWRGILGEDGVMGISWDLDNRSHIHSLYQQLLGALADSGVLIGVASRNDHALVLEALEREDFLLSKDSLFPLEINWQQKSRSIGKILRAWNIKADAVVFVDDSPLELAEVKDVYPEMECLLFPKNDDQAGYQFLHNLRDLFGKQAVLEEDAIRVESLRRSVEFQVQSETMSQNSPGDFLQHVEAGLSFSPIDAAGAARAFELINKTNQFNINGQRLSAAEFQNAVQRLGGFSLLVSYRDKFGPLGKIAVLLGRVEYPSLKIDTWVMSCRAFGRHIEHKCLEYLFDQWDVAEIELGYQATARNEPAREFLSQFWDQQTDSACKIQRQVFMSRKPALFHSVNGVSYV
jgi:FkbH-like protein